MFVARYLMLGYKNKTSVSICPGNNAIPGYYLFAEGTYRKPGVKYVLETPPGLFASYQGPFLLKFWYHMLGRDIGSLMVSLTAGTTTTPFTKTGQGQWCFMLALGVN